MSPIRRVLLSLLIVVLASGAVWAAFWQLRRLDQRRLANAPLIVGRDLPPINLGPALREGAELAGRRVEAQGHFLPSQLLLRGRVQNQSPGLHVVTGFELSGGGPRVWILRGFVPSPDATRPPVNIAAPDTGEVTIEGVMLPIPETSDQGQPVFLGSDTTWRRLDRGVMFARLTGSATSYLHVTGEGTGPSRLAPVPLPAIDEGPHFGYAIQWFGIAIAILAFGWLMVWRRRPAVSTPTE